MVVLDDLMNSARESSEIERVFVKYLHQRNLSITYIVQNVFCWEKRSCTINLNTKHMFLFKNPRDKLLVVSLARRMYSSKAQFFLEAFEDAIKRPYRYLVVDLNTSTSEKLGSRKG